MYFISPSLVADASCTTSLLSS